MMSVKIKDEEINEGVLGIFSLLAQIPHMTHHEEEISRFILGFCRDRGCEAVQDAVGNVIVEIPATSGLEAMPRVILQAHMDMVAVTEPGYAFDPVRDHVRLKRDGDLLRAVGTSLGADDGIGVAMILYILECGEALSHGPIRGIFTVDEEDGMDGVMGLDSAHLSDADYLINLDSEESDTITNSCAGGAGVEFLMSPLSCRPKLGFPLRLEVGGILGGHSGCMIHKGRINANIALCALLSRLWDRGIPYELTMINGGTARNAIPASAYADILINESDRAALEKAAAEYSSEMNEKYAVTDPGFTVTVTELAEKPERVISNESASALLSLAAGLINGVHRMSEKLPGLVESSSNLGIIRADTEGFRLNAFARSSEYDSLRELAISHRALGERLGFTCEDVCPSEPWPIREGSRLLACAVGVYEELNGLPPKIEAIHAGLECGNFSVMNPRLDMISVGPDLADVHSPDETLVVSSVAKVVKWVLGILKATPHNSNGAVLP